MLLLVSSGLIIQSPMSMVAALGTNVTFTCRVIGSILWSINGIQVFPNGVEDFVLSGIFVPAAQLNISSVRILAGPFNNGTTLSCLVEKFPGILNESELVNFTSYGELLHAAKKRPCFACNSCCMSTACSFFTSFFFLMSLVCHVACRNWLV